MNWLFIVEIVYVIILVLVCLRIIYDTRSSDKTIAYLLFAIFFPVLGIIFYFSFGVNYRKRKMYTNKFLEDEALLEKIKTSVVSYTNQIIQQSDPILQNNRELVSLLARDLRSPLTRNNRVKLLKNGEEKFPEVMEAIRQAKHHIHIEYYIFEDDGIGQAIAELLLEKVKEGVEVRFIYDDFGSRSVRKSIVPRLKAGGVKAFPFHRIIFLFLANRLNYRNHRKIIIIDGQTAFTGGINVSDKYINTPNTKLFWRDTHLRIEGPGVYYLQYIFLTDWNFCSGEQLQPEELHFLPAAVEANDTLVQIASSGPDSTQPSILYSLLQAVYLAEKEILVSTPYFIPGESMVDALTIAALSGLSVKVLVPGVSDIGLVNAAARCCYGGLLDAGVEIYQYQKGFMHAKTLVADSKLSVVGTANMDYRSFELNFEVNAIVYDPAFSSELRDVFYTDIKDATKIDPAQWKSRPLYKQMGEKLAGLLSPLL